MQYQFARIDLSQTDYQESVTWRYLDPRQLYLERCHEIYRDYCRYRKFTSVMPLFNSQLMDPMIEVIGYWDQDHMQAWSIMRELDRYSVMAQQFAWNYHQPQQRLGIRSLETECAIYRDRGYQWLYLDHAHHYKRQFQGFEILGPMS
jgi:hypothetical protein